MEENKENVEKTLEGYYDVLKELMQNEENKENQREVTQWIERLNTVRVVQDIVRNSENIVRDSEDKKFYASGNLYELEVGEKRRIPSAFFLDENTYNYHLFPYDCENLDKIEYSVATMERIAYEISKLRDKVIKELKKIIPNDCDIKKKGRDGNIVKLDGTYYSSKGANHLYRYILVTKKDKEGKDIKYELNFMRFFIDGEENDKKVNCILKAIQFDRALYPKGKEVVNCGKDGSCDICYPDTSEVQSEKELNEIREDRKEESFCYNPPISFYDTADKIAKAFIDFIDDCDKWSHDNNEQIFDEK